MILMNDYICLNYKNYDRINIKLRDKQKVVNL